MESEAQGQNLSPESVGSSDVAPSLATSSDRTAINHHRIRRLAERWQLTPDQEARRIAVRQEIAERWPQLAFEVVPVQKVLDGGELITPEVDAWFGVRYVNGPRLMDMREVIAGRTRICSRIPTVGSVLWVHAQSTWRDMLGGEGRVVIQPFDLSDPEVVAEINAIDAWADEVGLSDTDVPRQEGWELLVAAQRVARESGKPWPAGSDAGVPVWDWRRPANALHPPLSIS